MAKIKVRAKDIKSAIAGEMIHIVVSFLIEDLFRISLHPTLATPRPIIAHVFIWTRDVGIPRLADAINMSVAVMSEMKVAPNGPISIISLLVVWITRWPNSELPMPKHGAIIKVATIIIKR